MNILFLHPNFPAQFKSPCIELAKEKHHIKFICQTHNGRELQGIEKLVLKGSGSHEKTFSSGKSEHDRIEHRASSYRESFIILRNEGWTPDVTISHSGWGCGLHLKEIWPRTYFVSYLEWWFDMESDLIKKLKQSPYFDLTEASCRSLWSRNIPAAFEMATSNQIIAPTEWQKQQLPILLRNNCRVVYDKINRNLFFPEQEKLSKLPLITYGTRGMEPMRCFPQFIKLLPKLLHKWPQLIVEIAGTDTISYGGKLPKEKSWKKWALNLLKSENIEHRVTWRGAMPLDEYADWLKKSWCHIYISEPFVTSWSYIEAMHCQIPMISSMTEASLEFKDMNPNCVMVNHNIQAELIEAINVKIRNIGNIKSLPNAIQGSQRMKLDNFGETHATSSIASLIADVEAATKV